MKIVSLCGPGHCPVVKIDDERIEIGEKDNVCVLTRSEWEILKQKILDKETCPLPKPYGKSEGERQNEGSNSLPGFGP